VPTYEYQCSSCGYRFEQRQSITAPPLEQCPQCHGPLRRLIAGGAGIVLKRAASAAGPGEAGNPRRRGSCSFETTHRTCCGRSERCDTPPCGS
jgi:putative FmdB family regulatory protein